MDSRLRLYKYGALHATPLETIMMTYGHDFRDV